MVVAVLLFSHVLAMAAVSQRSGYDSSHTTDVSVNGHVDEPTTPDHHVACAFLIDSGAARGNVHPLIPHNFVSVSPTASWITCRSLPAFIKCPFRESQGQLRALLQVYLM